MRFGPQYIEKDTWQHQLAISNNSQQSAANSALHCDLTLLTIRDRGSLEIWVVSISLNSQTRQSLSTNRAFSSLLAPEWEQSQKVEAFQHSQHPRAPSRAERSISLDRRACGNFPSLSQNSSWAVSTISRCSLNSYISICPNLNTQQLKSAIQLVFKAIQNVFSFKKSISKWWNELLGSDDFRSLYYFHNNKE